MAGAQFGPDPEVLAVTFQSKMESFFLYIMLLFYERCDGQEYSLVATFTLSL